MAATEVVTCNYWQKKLKASEKQQLKLNNFFKRFFLCGLAGCTERSKTERRFFLYDSFAAQFYAFAQWKATSFNVYMHGLIIDYHVVSLSHKYLREKMQFFWPLNFFPLSRSRVFLKGKLFMNFCVWDSYIKYGIMIRFFSKIQHFMEPLQHYTLGCWLLSLLPCEWGYSTFTVIISANYHHINFYVLGPWYVRIAFLLNI